MISFLKWTTINNISTFHFNIHPYSIYHQYKSIMCVCVCKKHSSRNSVFPLMHKWCCVRVWVSGEICCACVVRYVVSVWVLCVCLCCVYRSIRENASIVCRAWVLCVSQLKEKGCCILREEKFVQVIELVFVFLVLFGVLVNTLVSFLYASDFLIEISYFIIPIVLFSSIHIWFNTIKLSIDFYPLHTYPKNLY